MQMLGIIIAVMEQVQHAELDRRIGLHFGFVGGISDKRILVDTWREDVLIGIKIESNGIPGQTCGSGRAKEMRESGSAAS